VLAVKVFSVSLPENLLKQAEEQAEKENRTKSELVREALRQYLKLRRWEELDEIGEEIARKRSLTEEKIAEVVMEGRYGKKD